MMTIARDGDQFGYIDPTAEVDATAAVGANSYVWGQATVCAQATIGRDCMVARYAMVGRGVTLGDGTRVQEGARLFAGFSCGENVFIGPDVIACNEHRPRVRTADDPPFTPETIVVGDGANVGANATLVPPLKIGAGSTIGAGSVVTRDVPPGVTVCGNPARILCEEGMHS